MNDAKNIAEHTPGNLIVSTHSHAAADLVVETSRRWVATIPRFPDSQANARRLAACWNACEGIPSDRLKLLNVPNIIALVAQRDALQREATGHQAALQRANDRWYAAAKERDALLAALQALLPHALHYATTPRAHADAHRDAANARVAIALCHPATEPKAA